MTILNKIINKAKDIFNIGKENIKESGQDVTEKLKKTVNKVVRKEYKYIEMDIAGDDSFRLVGNLPSKEFEHELKGIVIEKVYTDVTEDDMEEHKKDFDKERKTIGRAVQSQKFYTDLIGKLQTIERREGHQVRTLELDIEGDDKIKSFKVGYIEFTNEYFRPKYHIYEYENDLMEYRVEKGMYGEVLHKEQTEGNNPRKLLEEISYEDRW